MSGITRANSSLASVHARFPYRASLSTARPPSSAPYSRKGRAMVWESTRRAACSERRTPSL
eukprot:2943021-Rhodomonas_salina.2